MFLSVAENTKQIKSNVLAHMNPGSTTPPDNECSSFYRLGDEGPFDNKDMCSAINCVTKQVCAATESIMSKGHKISQSP